MFISIYEEKHIIDNKIGSFWILQTIKELGTLKINYTSKYILQ
jgi:hypothetical protein